jgi:hypothetical protein
MKKCMHLVEINIFSLNLDIVRLTKNINRANKNLKVGLLVKYFSERFNQFLAQKNDFESTNFEVFKEVGHNFSKSDDGMIL